MTRYFLLVTDAFFLDVPLLVHLNAPLVERVAITGQTSGVAVDDRATLALLALLALLVIFESLDQVLLFSLALLAVPQGGAAPMLKSLGFLSVLRTISWPCSVDRSREIVGDLGRCLLYEWSTATVLNPTLETSAENPALPQQSSITSISEKGTPSNFLNLESIGLSFPNCLFLTPGAGTGTEEPADKAAGTLSKVRFKVSGFLQADFALRLRLTGQVCSAASWVCLDW